MPKDYKVTIIKIQLINKKLKNKTRLSLVKLKNINFRKEIIFHKKTFINTIITLDTHIKTLSYKTKIISTLWFPTKKSKFHKAPG